MTARPAFLSLALLATVLAAAIVVELGDAPAPAGNGTGIVPIRQKPKAGPRAAAQDPSDRTNAWLTTALARPLFSLDRRPTDADPSTATTLGSLPWLTGVVTGPFRQSAIFAATGGGRPTVVGKTLGEYTVGKIGPGIVTVRSGGRPSSLTCRRCEGTARHGGRAAAPVAGSGRGSSPTSRTAIGAATWRRSAGAAPRPPQQCARAEFPTTRTLLAHFKQPAPKRAFPARLKFG